MRNRTTIDKAKEAITNAVYEGRLNVAELVELINHAGAYANVTPVAQYAKEEGITIQGAAKSKDVVKIFGKKFIAY